MCTQKQYILNRKEELGLLHDGFFYDDESDGRSVVRGELKDIKKALDAICNLACGIVLTIPVAGIFFTNNSVNQEIFYILFYNDDMDSLDVIINNNYLIDYSVTDLIHSKLAHDLYLSAKEIYATLELHLGPHLTYLRENNYDTVVYIGKTYGGTRIWFTTIEEYERCCK